ncbi:MULTISPECIES: response regulator [Giesbergeria]|uniref:Response regulator n=1 Tax=Giesbergeria sinuosa TaxID=80883 RepID=A0ABV9QD31_9BURK
MQILVVDDDPLAAEMVGAVLQELGHHVLLAENAMEAISQLNEHPSIEMVISDMNMPLISGIDLFRELREQGNALPFILLTGDDPDKLRTIEPRLGACVLKDFHLDSTLPAAMTQARTATTTSE